MDIYHKNKRFLIAVLITILITAVIVGVNNPTIRLSPEQVFQSIPISGSECKCIITGENAAHYAQLAEEGKLTVLSVEKQTSSDCLKQTSCTMEVRLQEDNFWRKETLVGNAMYSG